MLKIAIVVEGGVVQDVLVAPGTECEVVIIDHDDMNADGLSRDERDKLGADKADGLVSTLGA